MNDQGKEAVNFQITLLIVFGVAVLLCITIIGVVIGIPLMIATWVVGVVFTIIASISANDGVAYRYPVSWRLIK